jgi:hypothetical protein
MKFQQHPVSSSAGLVTSVSFEKAIEGARLKFYRIFGTHLMTAIAAYAGRDVDAGRPFFRHCDGIHRAGSFTDIAGNAPFPNYAG